jgi:hypothetical protein
MEISTEPPTEQMQMYLRISLALILYWTAEVTALSFCTLHAGSSVPCDLEHQCVV